VAKLIKGSKRYVLLRGKDELNNDIVIDIFDKKTLNKALKEERISLEDNIVMVEVLGKAAMKTPKTPRK
jgi:hypothetical protein